ncbi:MAG: DUF547 domain-containing protein, partial [Steroidobacteraceae bacterium]
SCPNLRSEAYRGDRLDEQLEDQVRRFLADPTKGLRLDREHGRVFVSRIFDWYGVDFAPRPDSTAAGDRVVQGVLWFVSAHTADPRVGGFLRDRHIRVGYLPYDWTLNDQSQR